MGLQEVALWRRGPDGVTDGEATPATTVVSTTSCGPTAQTQGARSALTRWPWPSGKLSIEAPIDKGYDVRLTMRDVILVKKRADLRITNRSRANYKADIAVPTPSGTLTSTRGWAAVDARLRGRRFRFVNTHLEAAAAAPRNAQLRSSSPLAAPCACRASR